MKLNNFLYLSILSCALISTGCSSSSSDDDNPPPPTGGGDDDPVVVLAPSAATLVFPEDVTECNTGVVDPNDETKSTVTFEWNISENTDRYTVTLTNLNTNSSTFVNSNTNEVDILIDRGTPYSWFVTSRANGTSESADSQVFRFFNEGPGVENYAPFPAEAVAPSRGATIATTTMVTLEWTASDIDDDIVSFEVFFGTEADPVTSIGSGETTSLEAVPVTSGTTYFWTVVTTDSTGNTSTSEIFQFKVG
ncbi:hypothetical protein MTsPCn5_25400 [Croceitalea sp. MTPC5]|uniref:hypothetical protein n=1 Tax=Croceitalea sp. MTPC5 TaxID=3056565 RepID=UPI002B3DD949|nr:hypothetical protein MTsPCn5_25400 [Croceitalea sp. MTPC5]